AGDLAGGCSTSGAAYKLPGRVGDSPVIGSGLYVDGQVGAAGATGLGEDVMRHGASLLVVEAMARGLEPQAACEQTLRRLAGRDPRGFGLDFHLIALDIYARYGGAGTRAGFRYAVTDDSGTRLLDGVHVQA
ncbi:MAG: isoaspartyl peptidase/L-asparaginase, partial [Gemmatimonadota bacterium]